MSLLAFLVGILLPTLLGWIIVALCERGYPVLTQKERIAWSLIFGPTLSMLLVFICTSIGLTNLNLIGFLGPIFLAIILLFFTYYKISPNPVAASLSSLLRENNEAPENPLPSWARVGIWILVLWTMIKLIAGAYDLVSVPTYWDDSFNNWNMRGKMFFVSEKIELEIPIGNGIVQTAQGVSSYPPTLPLMKTWVSVLRGSFEEPLVNGIHLVWISGLLLAFYGTLRRRLGRMLSLLGTSLLCSMPLVLIHAMNPYAEIFVASHLFLAVVAIFHLQSARTIDEFRSWSLLFTLALGLLLFTKNEALVLYTPILLILFAWVWRKQSHAHVIRTEQTRKLAALLIPLLLALTLPWIAFKWLHGLTFGNAKSVSGVSLGFNFQVLKAIWYHLSHQPNFLLLPLVLPLALIAVGRRAFSPPVGILTIFVLASLLIQFSLFLTVGALATEAINQTGLSRGLVQVAPVAMLLVLLLVEIIWKNLFSTSSPLAPLRDGSR